MAPARWPALALCGPAGLVEIGHPANGAASTYDNEAPRHRVWLRAYAIANGWCATAIYATFHRRWAANQPPENCWLSEGWSGQRWLRAGRRPALACSGALPPVGSGNSAMAGAPPPASRGSVSPSQLVQSRRLCPRAGARLASEAKWEALPVHGLQAGVRCAVARRIAEWMGCLAGTAIPTAP